ncbi:MAG: hypothetical protein OXN16_05030 [Gammaproteobacteria bacterium]|nr:hypothetical protein [Gammaproteobacteria bacterium]
MAFPFFAMQKAISSIGVLWLRTINALEPLAVSGLQFTKGRDGFSGFMLVNLLIYNPGALLMIFSLASGPYGSGGATQGDSFPERRPR